MEVVLSLSLRSIRFRLCQYRRGAHRIREGHKAVCPSRAADVRVPCRFEVTRTRAVGETDDGPGVSNHRLLP